MNKSPQTLRGSFSAVSTPPIARIGASFSIFRDLQDLQIFGPFESNLETMKSASCKRLPGAKHNPGEENSRPHQCEVDKRRCTRHSALPRRVGTAQMCAPTSKFQQSLVTRTFTIFARLSNVCNYLFQWKSPKKEKTKRSRQNF